MAAWLTKAFLHIAKLIVKIFIWWGFREQKRIVANWRFPFATILFYA